MNSKILALMLMFPVCAFGQWTPYGLGLIQKPNAASARAYLGVLAFTNGTGITFTVMPSGVVQISNSGAGSGTVTSFSAGNLVPLFTTSVATATTTPALSFALSSQSANVVFAGPTTGAAAAPTFRSLVSADLPAISLNSLSDVVITGPATGQLLEYDGANWVNAAAYSLTVEEEDGTPSVTGVNEIKVSNGTLTDNGGGSVSVTTGSGGGSDFNFMIGQTNRITTMRTIAADVATGTTATFNGFGDTLIFSSSGGAGAAPTMHNLNSALAGVGPYADMRTSTTINSIFFLSTSTLKPVFASPGGSFFYQIYIVPRNTNDVRILAGFTAESGITTLSNDSVTTNYCVFRYSSAAGDETWKAVTSGGAAVTVTDTAVPVVPDTAYLLQFSKSGGTITFTVNRTTSVNVSANIPNTYAAAGESMAAFFGMRTLSGATKTNLVRYMGYEVDWAVK